jgi:hypothetical protein
LGIGYQQAHFVNILMHPADSPLLSLDLLLYLRLHNNQQELAHAQWPAVPGRSKDYIARPKPNGYQSLHSTLSMQAMQQLMASNSSSSSDSSSVVLSYLELQVRTAAMHAAAEGGDAAHAGYKGRLERRQVRRGRMCCCCCCSRAAAGSAVCSWCAACYQKCWQLHADAFLPAQDRSV